MSSPTTAELSAAPAGDSGAAGPPPRSMVRRVLGDTLSRWGARVGFVWVAILVFLGVFAPLIANSQPIAVKVEGRWSSPMLRHMGALDITLLVVFFAAVVLLMFRRVAPRWRWLIFLGVTVGTGLVTGMTVTTPTPVVHEQWREAQAAGQVERILYAPIPYSPNDRVRDRTDTDMSGPLWAGHAHNHWLGQDPLRQDIASRMIHAARIALGVGFIATSIAIFLGILIGAPMGYFSGGVDLVGMRLVEVFEFIPQLFLLLIFAAFFPGDYPEILSGIRIQRIYLIMGIIGLTGWAGYARFVRAEFLKIRKQDYVQAARACGLPLRSVLFKHMLPNGLAPVLVSASFGVASAILSEATLSFLGLGLNEDPSWGTLLDQAVKTGTFIWWIAIFPGAAIFLTVFAYNMIGEALRDAIDPHTRRLDRG